MLIFKVREEERGIKNLNQAEDNMTTTNTTYDVRDTLNAWNEDVRVLAELLDELESEEE